MRILVTGPTGFIGSHAVQALRAAGHSVVGVCRKPFGDGVEADLLASGEAERVVNLSKPDVVLHLAWTTEHGKFWNDPDNERWLATSTNLVRAAFESGARRFVGVGTCFEYAWPEHADCVEDVTPLAEHLPYDKAKSAFHASLKVMAEQHRASYSWARLFHLYGPNENPARLVSSIAKSIAASQPANCSTGRVLRDFMDARDAGAAIAALTVSGVSGAVNIASGEPAHVSEIATLMGRLASKPELVNLGALPDRPNDPPRITASVVRLRDEVGFRNRYTLKDGLNDALKFWSDAA